MYQYTTEEAFTLESMPELILDPEKVRLEALGLPSNHTGRVESTEESVPKEENHILLKYFHASTT